MTTKRRTGARDAALDMLIRVEERRSYSNLEVKHALEHGALSPADKALATELVYGTIQRQNTLDAVLARFVKGGSAGVARLEPWVRNLFRLSLYQLRYLDRIPARAAVHEAVEIAKRRGHPGIASLVNGVLRNVLRRPGVWEEPPGTGAAAEIAFFESHPEWLVRRWLDAYGEETARAICRANNRPPRAAVRVNRLKTDRASLLAELKREFPEAEASPVSPDGILLGRGFAAGSRWFQEGYCTVQDESSMLVAPALAPEPGQRVLDACAAPGGKTTHIAELMDNRGSILACDVHPHKEELIRENAARLGVTIVETLVCDAAELSGKEVGLFDRILLDAPCTGFGVIRRKPDIKWNKREEDIAAIADMQYRLLERVSRLLKPGGLLLYSTCTIEPEENRQLVERFAAAHPEFSLDPALERDLPEAVLIRSERGNGWLQILPHHFDSDGFFLARLRRT